jgi:leader peptidase (prepilin peptidase)/N-methyltransferase
MIAWYDNIPLLSYLVLGRKCRGCRQKISGRYFLVEALTGLLFLMVWLKMGDDPRPLGLTFVAAADWKVVVLYWIAVSGLVLGTFVDFDFMIIPDRVTLGGIVAGIVFASLVPELHGEERMVMGFRAALLGASVGWLILWSVARIGTFVFRKEAMGMGDVKLLAAIGAFLGWRAVVFSLMVSAMFGSIVGISLVVMKKKAMQSRIPFGPYLALAALVWMFWGPSLWQWYLNLFMPPLS